MFKLWVCCALFAAAYAYNHGEDLIKFQNYMNEFKKQYSSAAAQNDANYYFYYHSNQVAQQNSLADRKASSYRVRINQYSDIRLIHFAANLPKAVYPTKAYNVPPISTGSQIPAEFNILNEYGINVLAQTQPAATCSSSWAYAAEKSIQIMNAVQMMIPQPVEYSAQYLIDCAGMAAGCTTQVPQIAFDFLSRVTGTEMKAASDYLPTDYQGMCKPLPNKGNAKLASYAFIADGDDNSVKRFVANAMPVIVEYNPATFGFMHYSSGVYVPEKPKASSSQFLVVVGYGHDADTKLDYWLCLNSFGETWGEKGFIKIVRDAKHPIALGAILPNTLV